MKKFILLTLVAILYTGNLNASGVAGAAAVGLETEDTEAQEIHNLFGGVIAHCTDGYEYVADEYLKWMRQEGAVEKTKGMFQIYLRTSQDNIQAINGFQEQLLNRKPNDTDELLEQFFRMRADYLLARIKSMRGDSPPASTRKQHDHPLNRLSADGSIAIHFMYTGTIKFLWGEASRSPAGPNEKAMEYFHAFKSIQDFLIGETDFLPDTDTAIISDIKKYRDTFYRNVEVLGNAYSWHKSDIASNAAKVAAERGLRIAGVFQGRNGKILTPQDRRRAKVIQRRKEREAKGEGAQAKHATASNLPGRAGAQPQQLEVAERARQAEAASDKTLQARRSASAVAGSAAGQAAGTAALASLPAGLLGPETGGLTPSSPTLAPAKPVKIKRTGRADPAKANGNAEDNSGAAGAAEANAAGSGDSGDDEEAATLILQGAALATFDRLWSLEAPGLTYDAFKYMFEKLGGRINENTGSSHRKLIYVAPHGQKHVGGTWAPHGGTHATGYGHNSIKYLRQYLTRCGLTLENLTQD